jgi:hypothetical protein
MVKTAWAALCAAFLICATPQAEAQESAYGIGPFNIGMSFDEARAQTPSAAWTDSHARLQSRGERHISTLDAFELDGLRFGADLRESDQGGYSIIADAEDRTSTDAATCQARALNILSLFETRIGAFTSSQPGIGFQQAAEPVRPRWGATTIRNSNGVMAVPYITYEGGAPAILARRVNTLGGSFAYVATWNADQRLVEPRDLTSNRIARFGFTAQRREIVQERSYSAVLNAEYQRGSPACRITIQIRRDPALPPLKS